MIDPVTTAMEAAATEVLQDEADQIDQEVQRLLLEAEQASEAESRDGRFTQRLLALLQRRGEVAGKALRWRHSTQALRRSLAG
jgi:hypothetical protein